MGDYDKLLLKIDHGKDKEVCFEFPRGYGMYISVNNSDKVYVDEHSVEQLIGLIQLRSELREKRKKNE